MSFFPVAWHYLGAVDCLLYPSPGAAVDSKYSEALCAALADDDFPLEDALTGAIDDVGESLLFGPVREVVARAHADHATHADIPLMAWERPGTLSGLRVVPFTVPKVGGGRPDPSVPDETVLTPHTFFLPWPWFDGLPNSNPHKRALRRRGDALVQDLRRHVLGGQYMAFRSALDATDYCVHCDTLGPDVERQIKDRAQKGKAYSVGPFKARPDSNRRKVETLIGLRSGKLEIRVGTGDNPSQTRTKGRKGKQLARYPCGAIDGNSQPCP